MAGTTSWLILSVLIIAIIHSSRGRVLTECQAVRELERARISRTFISNWVCLMKSESRLNTAAVNGPKAASSYSYGILQINSAEWCARGRVGGKCNKRCEDFMNDDIQDDIACAKKIYNQSGFNAWSGWVNHCKNKPLLNIGKC